MPSNKLININNRIEWLLTLETVSPLFIGGHKETDEHGNYVKSTELKALENSNGDFIIPGSSFRGVLSKQIHEYLSIILETDERKLIQNYLNDLFGKVKDEKEAKNDDEIKSRIWISDTVIDKKHKYIKYIVPIDRISHIPQKGILNYHTIKAKTKFQIKIVLENCKINELGYLGLFYRDLLNEQVWLGSGKGRGFGNIKLLDIETKAISFGKDNFTTIDNYNIKFNDNWKKDNDFFINSWINNSVEESINFLRPGVESLKNLRLKEAN